MAIELTDKFIREIGKAMDDAVIEKMHKAVLYAHARLVEATPVDLGQARAGWNIGINKQITTIPERPKKGEPKLPKPETVAKKVSSTKDVYHISNFVEHIIYLNEGHSVQQAEPGFVEREIHQAIKDVENS